ncbi:MAG: hypothetical protein AAFV88_21220 [Planctomycetota bacterium]
MNTNDLQQRSARGYRFPAIAFLMFAYGLLAATMTWVVAHRYENNQYRTDIEALIHADAGLITVKSDTGFPFSSMSEQYDVIDLRSRQQVNRWFEHNDQTWIIAVSDDGSTAVLSSRFRDTLVVRHAAPKRGERMLDLDAARGLDRYYSRFVDDDAALVGVSSSGPFVSEVETGFIEHLSFDHPTSSQYCGKWETDLLYNFATRVSCGSSSKHTYYKRCGKQLTRVAWLPDSEDTSVTPLVGTNVLMVPGLNRIGCLDSDAILQVEQPGKNGCWGDRPSEVLLFAHKDKRGLVSGVTMISEVDGQPLHSFDFARPQPKSSSLFVVDDHVWSFNDGSILCFDRDGKQVFQYRSSYDAWFPRALGLIASVGLFWVVLTWLTRRSTPSWVPVISVSVLFATVLVASTVRLFTGTHRYLPSEPESGVFFGATFALATIITFWFVFGRTAWPYRIATVILVFAINVGVYLGLWLKEGSWNMSLLAPAFLLALAAFLCGVYRLKLRFHHRHEISQPQSWVGARFQLGQLILWTLAFAILFGVLRFTPELHAKRESIWNHSVQGAAGGIAAALIACAVLVRRWSLLAFGIAIVVIACICWTLNNYLGEPPRWDRGVLFHPGGSFLSLIMVQSVLLAATAWAARINGYRLGAVWEEPVRSQ